MEYGIYDMEYGILLANIGKEVRSYLPKEIRHMMFYIMI